MEEEERKMTDVVASLAQHTFTPTPTQLPVFQQFINVDWNDHSVLNESYLVHLLNKGKEQRIRGWTKLMILLFVVNDNKYEEYTKSLLNLKEQVNQKAECGYTALIIAARHGLTSKCKVLVNSGANLNVVTDWGATALMFCAEAVNNESNFDTFKLLIDSGADINIVLPAGTSSALCCAVDASHMQSVEYLIAKGVQIPQDVYFIAPNGTKMVRGLFLQHIFPPKRWSTKLNFYIGELLLKHAPLEVTQNLLAHVCSSIQNNPDQYVINVRGLEVLIERGAYLTPQLLAIESSLLKNLLLQAYSNVNDRQYQALRENNIMKSIAKEFGNSQDSAILATTLCYLNCDASLR